MFGQMMVEPVVQLDPGVDLETSIATLIKVAENVEIGRRIELSSVLLFLLVAFLWPVVMPLFSKPCLLITRSSQRFESETSKRSSYNFGRSGVSTFSRFVTVSGEIAQQMRQQRYLWVIKTSYSRNFNDLRIRSVGTIR